MHDDIRNYLGTIELNHNNSPLGVRGKAKFNKTAEGRKAKKLVHEGAIESLSIWANEVIEEIGRFELEPGVVAHKSVTGGVIREVSLVVRGMNPGAKIDEVIRHSNDPLDPDTFVHDGLIIHSGLPIEIDLVDEEEDEEIEEVETEETEETEEVEEVEEEETEEVDEEDETISHEDEETIADILDTLNEKQMLAVDALLHSAVTGETLPQTSSEEGGEDGENLGEIFDTLSDKQKEVVQYLAGALAEENADESEEEPEEEPEEESISQGDPIMPKTYNPFESAGGSKSDPVAQENVLNLLQSAKAHRAPSLRELFTTEEIGDDIIQHSVTDIDFMFPDARAVQPGGPQYFADRDMSWVRVVLNGVRPRPFSRIKSWYANISGADARAKGYVTGNQKVEEVIAVLKRTTVPQTIYKFQKLDRDDVLDITDFNVVVWLKAEMRMMLEEELARAVLISDGRNDTGDDAILSANVRPIYNDADVYTHKSIYNDVGSEDDWANFTDTEVLAFVDHVARSLTYYRGSGSPTLFCQPELISKMLLVRDTTGRRIHDNLSALAAAMRVSRIVEIPVMAGLEATGVVDPTGTDQNGAAIPAGTYDIATMGIIVNLQDYVIGADNGGQTAFFDDFDLNFNKYEYLSETRVSGALVNPKSAIAVQLVTAKTA
jgi:hypothetical protein